MQPTDRFFSMALTLISAVFVGFVLFVLQSNFMRLDDVMTYRMAYNVAHGEGVVFNADESAWPTLSPLWPTLLGGFVAISEALSGVIGPEFVDVPQNYYFLLASGLTAAVYGLLASSIYHLLRGEDYSRQQTMLIIGLFIIGQPLWVGMRSPAPLTLLFILNALHALKDDRRRLAGLLGGLAMLTQPSGILGAIALGIYALRQEKAWRYWQTVWIPLGAWVLYAALSYEVLLDGLLAHRQASAGNIAQTMLWVVVLIGALWAIKSGWQALLAAWAAAEIALATLLMGEVPVIGSVALVLVSSAVLGKWITQRHWAAVPLVTIWLGVYLIFPVQTDSTLTTDLALSKTIYLPQQADLLHDRGDVIIYHQRDFTGNVYRFDGTHSPFLQNFATSGDYESAIIALAPDFIYVNTSTLDDIGLNLRSDTLAPLRYRLEIDVQLDPGQREGDQFWFRDREIADFGTTIALDRRLNPDIQLVSYALDRSRFSPQQPLRLRLDWQLDDFPRYPIGLQINLLDINGLPLTAIFPSYQPEMWAQQTFSTYHVLLVPPDTIPQTAAISIAVDYRAAIVGDTQLGQVVIRSEETPPDTRFGRINSAILYAADVSTEADRLQVELLWGTAAPLGRDYQVFVHLIPVDDVQPAATGDSAPVGGRFPTSIWRPNEVVRDPHTVALESVPPGSYNLNVGFYVLETFERLRDENGDNLTIARITIDADGAVRVQPVQ